MHASKLFLGTILGEFTLKKQTGFETLPLMHARENQTVRTIGLALALVTLILFLPAVHHEFTNYDDHDYIIDNYHVTSGLSLENIRWAFCTGHASNWHPLTWVSHMLDCQLYGLNPGGHYLTNILFHIANSVLLFLLLHQLTAAIWRSAIVAALFAWHPIHVESVAWAAERKDVLSAFFFMLTLIQYTRYVHQSEKALHFGKHYWLALAFFACGLMSKPMLVTTPFVLLLLDFWPLNRIIVEKTAIKSVGGWRTVGLIVIEKVPFLLLSTASSTITLIVQQGAMAPLQGFPISLRLENAAVAYLHYFEKAVWPHPLATIYPMPPSWPAWLIASAFLFIVFTSFFSAILISRKPFFTAGWLWFLGTLVPVIGIVQVGSQSIADRYSYIPFIGLFILFVWGLSEVAAKISVPQIVIGMASATVLAACILLTSRQLRFWQNPETLFTHAIEVVPNNYIAYNQLGLALADAGKMDDAIAEYKIALQIKPGYPESLNNLGMAFFKKGNAKKAIEYYQAVLEINPHYLGTQNNMGVALEALGRHDEAITFYLAALNQAPTFDQARFNLALALASKGDTNGAIQEYYETLKINPGNALANYNLGCILSDQGNWHEALNRYIAAAELDPNNADVHNNLGFVLMKLGRSDNAIDEFLQALKLNPNLWMAHYNIGNIFSHASMWHYAIDQYGSAIHIQPNVPELHYQLGVALLQCGKTSDADAEFHIAVQLKPELQSAIQKHRPSYEQK